MKILNCHKYRDGGTFCVETDHGYYWLPVGFETGVWKGVNFFRGNAELVSDEREINTLMRAMADDSHNLQWIKRHLL